MSTKKRPNSDVKEGRQPAGTNGREVLLDAASNLMIETGSIDVSLHQIARRAGLTAPLVKYWFGSREGLLLALAERDVEGPLSQLADLMDQELDPATKLRIHIHGIISAYAQFPYLNRLIDQLLWDRESEGSKVLRARVIQPIARAQRTILSDGVAAGQFREVNVKYMYFLIVGTCHYIFSTRVGAYEVFGVPRITKEISLDYAAFATDTILRGIST
ncbi:MAG: TetR family transcriptional regulator [Alphaproteobacteria bacterium]|nr:TetR family transcriptional regulator [Alphaproteobacteria bacterium]|tara:strand:+ start:2626 stop:3276 length:651 start_codon:yes stop_codon:yes gene_type:complete